jgi:PAS domain S-box-containing protein
MSDEQSLRIADLEDQVQRLEQTCQVLMDRVESSIDHTGSAFSLFERNILLEQHIRQRTQDLERANQLLKSEIAERLRAERLSMRLKAAVEQSTDGILITDVSGAIRYANPAFLAMTGYTVGELVGHDHSLLNGPEQDDNFYRDRWESLCRGGVWKGRLRQRRKDGSSFAEEQTVSPVRSVDGQISNLVLVSRDVSKEVLLEAQLRQKQKLESIGTLAGGIAHDFNNLLTPILIFAQALRDDLEGQSQACQDLEHILVAANRAKDLVSQILDFSLEAKPDLTAISIREVVAEILPLLRSALPSSIEVRTMISDRTDAVECDSSQLHQVVMNLCMNAVHAMRDSGGVLTIEVEPVFRDTEFVATDVKLSPGSYVRVAVRDTGCGMDAATISRIFEPFFTTKDVGQGTGLGLSVVYGIVKGYGGGITVQSWLGAGSSFEVFLPLSQAGSRIADQSGSTEIPDSPPILSS